MTDMMVDLETTGKNPVHNGIIQIGAIKFNYRTGEIGDTFDRCLCLLPNRYWDEDTRQFWMTGENLEVYHSIVARMEPGAAVLFDFARFALEGAPDGGYRFWAKPVHFDWNFVASHFEQIHGHMPFHYRYARDMNSFIAGLRGEAEHFSMEAVVPFRGAKHNALHDAAYQVDCLMHAKRGDFAEVLPPE